MNPFYKNKYFLIIAGTILIITIMFFIIYSIVTEIEKMSFEVVSEKNKKVILEKEKENIKKIENIYKTQAENFAKIDNLFVNSETPIELIKFLEETAEGEQLKLEIHSINKNIKKEDHWPSLILELETKGSFSNFLKFLEKIENCNYLIEPLRLTTRKMAEKELEQENKDFFTKDLTVNNLLIKVYSK